MEYSSFLFSQLLREFSPKYDELPYDEMYGAHINLLLEFEKSEFNVDSKPEYDCICDFLNSKDISSINF